jgi:hypothetical protein
MDERVRPMGQRSAGGGRAHTPIEELQHRAAAYDAAIRALLSHARDVKHAEANAYRAVARKMLSERNDLIKKIVARGGHYYTGTRVKLVLRTGGDDE